MKRIHSGIWLVILVAAVLLLFDVPLSAGENGGPAETPAGAGHAADIDLNPLARLNTKSPRATMKNFLETMSRAYQIQMKDGYRSRKAMELLGRSATCLDLSKIPPTLVENKGIESVLFLKEIFDRIGIPPYEEIPDHATMETNGWSRWTIPNTEITVARVAEGPREGKFLFTPGTVKRLPEFYKRVQGLPYKPGASENIYESYIYSPGWMIPYGWIDGLPEWTKIPLFGQALWQWLGMVFSLLLGGLVVWLIYRLEYHRSRKRDASLWEVGKLLFPISGMALSILIGYFIDLQINITGTILIFVTVVLELSFFVFACVTIIVLGNILVRGITGSPRLRPKSIDANLITLILRVSTLILIFGVVWFAAGDFGLPVTAIFASAGVVGVAVALAARETLANFFGGVSVLLDRPFRTGDYIVLDSGERGEVMEIGLRSTRLLTRDEILICVPNSVITNVKVVNESAPIPRFRVRIKIGVAYGTDIDRVEEVLIDVATRNDLVATEPEPRVRFRAFGDSSLDFELLCWAKRPHDKGRLIHSLNREIYRAFNAENIVIPFPQRDIHMDPNPDGKHQS